MVEAMACGVPTITANTSCLPEISGGVLRYFNPNSAEDIADLMESVLLSRDLRTELAERGREHAQRFSWDLCAQETATVLEQTTRACPRNADHAGRFTSLQREDASQRVTYS